MSVAERKPFTGWRAFFWPIYRDELKMLLPLSLIFFLITLNYNILRVMKDTILVTAKGSGAEVIPYVKVWAMLPMSIGMTWIFTRLANRYSREKVFYMMFGGFLLFFGLFAFLFYPYREQFHLQALANHLEHVLPVGLKGFVMMVRYWSFSIFYAMCELWGNIVLFLLFWGFVNEITEVSQAKRFYGLFGLGINFSGFISGIFSAEICKHAAEIPLPFEDAWHKALVVFVGIVVVGGVITLGLYYWMNRRYQQKTQFFTQENLDSVAPKNRLSLRENFRYINRSPYLKNIMWIVLAYNIVINLVEVLWKYQVRELYPDPLEYNTYMNEVTAWIGGMATFTALFICGNCIRFAGWTFTALLTPVILLATSILFFGAFFFKDQLPLALLGLVSFAGSPLGLIVFFGTLQNALSRAAKYTVFDATRELTFVPLSVESRLRGKAAIDGICTRLGKSMGSASYQMLLGFCGSIAASAPYVAVILFAAIGRWIVATVSLGKQFHAAEGGQEQAPARAPSPAPQEGVLAAN